ncbi:glycolipid 2-alpha-mannosyltransferase [Monosporozyma servazzii]
MILIPFTLNRRHVRLGTIALAFIFVIINLVLYCNSSSKAQIIDKVGSFTNEHKITLTDMINDGQIRNFKNSTTVKSKDILSFIRPSFANKGQRPKACFVTLVKNSEFDGIVKSIRNVQKKFNSQFKYDWIFLNDEEFTEEFKLGITNEISSVVKFGLIPKEHWSYPEYIDQSKAAETRKDMARVIYGSSESYRHMCRYQSGFFWRHPLLDDYDWYWRVEPDIKLYCDTNYDVFQWMQDHEKVYGFTLTMYENKKTINTLWNTTVDFFDNHPEYISSDNLMEFISNDQGHTYNLCHFWSNFEIANLNLWRSPQYQEYFDYLDHAGGFFYERWGDAPIHSIAASLLLPKDKIHHFADIGYRHKPNDNCPIDTKVWEENNCECNPEKDFTFHKYGCGTQFYDAAGIAKPKGWETHRG